MKIKLLTASWLFLIFLFFPNQSFANEHFSVARDMTYTVQDNAMTHVTIRTSLTNKSSQYYATENGIGVGFPTIENVKASDPDGPISPEVVKEDKGYLINVHFTTHVVGIDKTLVYTIEFDTPDIVQQQGNIYEVDIPGVTNSNEYTNYTVQVQVPSYFGQPQYIKPDVGRKTLDFTKEDLGKGGISIAFGENQMYSFSLTYHIHNTHVFPIRRDIALPPDTNYQQVDIEHIDPKPLDVKKDGDGNWLATYTLLPSKGADIHVTGRVKVGLFPTEQKESEEVLRQYLLPKKYWESDTAEIKSLASTLKTPEAIYKYVEKKLSYDFSRVTQKSGRVGATGVLQKPTSAVCLEFSDLFIALARAAGIPAREIDGFGYTQNVIQRPVLGEDDILHVWPEYYDRQKNTWVMVDPTWGNTTGGVDYFNVLDFSHIAFVIKGNDSSYPIPAGGYKIIGAKTNKDVHITPISGRSFPSPHATAEIHISKKNFSMVPLSGTVRVVNTGGVAYPPEQISIKSDDLAPSLQKTVLSEILPFGTTIVPFTFNKTKLFTHKNATITVQIGSSRISETVAIVPLYTVFIEQPLLTWIIGGGVIFASSTIIIWILAQRSRNISVS